ncbi:MAG: arylsulfatase [Planctomycetota bacterium]
MRVVPCSLAAILFASCSTAPAPGGRDARGSRPPNIVIVLADDLGYGDPGCYNDQSKIATPNIDRLAREGMRFTDAHSPSAVCSPTRYGLLTGRFAWRTRLQSGVLWPWDVPLIDEDRQTLPAMLRAIGYRTECVGKWHLGWDWPLRDGGHLLDEAPAHLFTVAERNTVQPRIDFLRRIRGGPLAAGFDHYFGDDVPNFPPYAFIEDDHLTQQPTAQNDERLFGHDGPMVPGWDLSAVLPAITQRAAAIIDEHARSRSSQPLFLYLALTSPHTPIAPSTRWAGTSGAGSYGDWVAETDWALGEVLDALDRNGLADDTLVVFTSDNGSPQRDAHAFTGPVGSVKANFGHDSSRPWRGLKGDAWEGGHRIPFLVRMPEVVSAGTTEDEPIELTDLFRTLAALTGARVAPGAAEDSVDFSDLLRGAPRHGPVHELLVMHSGSGLFAVRQGSFKLILGKGSGGFSRYEPPPDAPEGQLYDLANDPGETENLYASRPELVTSLRAALQRVQRGERR